VTYPRHVLLTGRLHSAEKICYGAPYMRVRSCISGLVVLLLALGVYSVCVSPQLGDRTSSPGRTQSPSGTSQVLSDLDGDGLADPVILDTEGLQHTIELHLSGTDEHMVLPLSAEAGDDGSLSAQDLDGDGDTDLLVQEPLPLPEVLVWLNDGAGRFECLCPPAPRIREFALSGPGVSASQRRPPASALSPERNPSPGYTRTPGWFCQLSGQRCCDERIPRTDRLSMQPLTSPSALASDRDAGDVARPTTQVHSAGSGHGRSCALLHRLGRTAPLTQSA
jgi:hypothetical protein